MMTPQGRAFLTLHKVSTDQLARATGISSAHIKHCLGAKRNMSMAMVARVAAYLGITIDRAMETFYHPELPQRKGRKRSLLRRT